MIIEKIDERYRGHLSKKEMQKIELKILKHVVKFCDENQITYFLYGGTLLGSIREKGFIPWDDDIDIAMPRPDYDRFIKTYENSDRYILNSFDKDKSYYFPFAKVYDNHTYLDERTTKRIPMGVYIDIFPIDVFDNNKFRYFLNKLKRGLIHTKIATIKKDNSFLLNSLILFGRIFTFWVPINGFLKSMEKNVRKIPINKAVKVGTVTEGYVTSLPYSYESISKTIDSPFEDIMVKVPHGYDEILTTLYGDYMTPPPPHKQKTIHEKFFCGYREGYSE